MYVVAAALKLKRKGIVVKRPSEVGLLTNKLNGTHEFQKVLSHEPTDCHCQ
jgi:hypothetical protein